MRVEADDLAETEIIQELHAGRVAAYALDHGDLDRVRRSGNRGKCDHSSESKCCKLNMAQCSGQEARKLTGIVRHDRSSSFAPPTCQAWRSQHLGRVTAITNCRFYHWPRADRPASTVTAATRSMNEKT